MRFLACCVMWWAAAASATGAPTAPTPSTTTTTTTTTTTAPTVTPTSTATPRVRRRVQVLDFQATSEAELARTVTKLITVDLSRRGYDVLASQDLAAAAAIDADRQAAGCDSTTCLLEIAEAMGADLLAYGDVARLNKTILVTVNVFDARTSSAVGREQLTVEDLDALPSAVRQSLDVMLGPTTAPPPAGPPVGALVSLGGAGLAVAGVVGASSAWLVNGDRTSSGDAKNLAIAAWPWTLGAVGVGAGVAAVGTVLWVME